MFKLSLANNTQYGNEVEQANNKVNQNFIKAIKFIFWSNYFVGKPCYKYYFKNGFFLGRKNVILLNK